MSSHNKNRELCREFLNGVPCDIGGGDGYIGLRESTLAKAITRDRAAQSERILELEDIVKRLPDVVLDEAIRISRRARIQGGHGLVRAHVSAILSRVDREKCISAAEAAAGEG